MIITKKDYIIQEAYVGDISVAHREIIRITIKEYGYIDTIFFEDGTMMTTTMPLRIVYTERKKQ